MRSRRSGGRGAGRARRSRGGGAGCPHAGALVRLACGSPWRAEKACVRGLGGAGAVTAPLHLHPGRGLSSPQVQPAAGRAGPGAAGIPGQPGKPRTTARGRRLAWKTWVEGAGGALDFRGGGRLAGGRGRREPQGRAICARGRGQLLAGRQVGEGDRVGRTDPRLQAQPGWRGGGEASGSAWGSREGARPGRAAPGGRLFPDACRARLLLPGSRPPPKASRVLI